MAQKIFVKVVVVPVLWVILFTTAVAATLVLAVIEEK